MPYFVPVVIASLVLDPLLVALASSLGSTIAKIIVFQGAHMGKRFVSEETRSKLRPFEKLSYRYGWLAAFIAAITPIPDDLVYVPLGFIGYKVWKFTASVFVGKLLFTAAISFGAKYSYPIIGFLVEDSSSPLQTLAVTLGMGALAVGTIYLIMRLDWAKLLGRWFPWTVGTDSGNPTPNEKK